MARCLAAKSSQSSHERCGVGDGAGVHRHRVGERDLALQVHDDRRQVGAERAEDRLTVLDGVVGCGLGECHPAGEAGDERDKNGDAARHAGLP